MGEYMGLWLQCVTCKSSRHDFYSGGLLCLHPDKPSGYSVIQPGDHYTPGRGDRCIGYDYTDEHCLLCHAHPCPVKFKTPDGKEHQFCSIEHANDYRNIGLNIMMKKEETPP